MGLFKSGVQLGPQDDFFESAEQVRLKHLKEKRDQLQKDLEEISDEIREITTQGKTVQVNTTCWLTLSSPGNAALLKESVTPYGKRSASFELITVFSLDKLRQAVEQLSQENHNDPKGIPGGNGSESSNPPW